LLSALATKSGTKYTVKQLRLVVISTFTYIFLNALTKRVSVDVSKFLGILPLFFERAGEVPEQCDGMVVATANWIAQQPPEAQAQSRDFFAFAAQFRRSEFVQCIAGLIFGAFRQRNSMLFQYCSLISAKLSDRALHADLLDVPQALFDVIDSSALTNEIAFGNAEYTHLPRSDGADALLQFRENDTFPNGCDLNQVVHFPADISIENLVNDAMVPRLTSFAEVTLIDTSHLPDVVERFVAILRANLQSPKIFDFYAVFFYIHQLFPPETLGVLPSDVFLNTTLFNPAATLFGRALDSTI
jgi:hypothetical protein